MASIVILCVVRVVYLTVRCDTQQSGKGVMGGFFSGNCDHMSGGGKKTRRNKKY